MRTLFSRYVVFERVSLFSFSYSRGLSRVTYTTLILVTLSYPSRAIIPLECSGSTNSRFALEHRYIHALCNFRMDQHDRFVKEISRVEDVLHRTRPLAKTKNKTLLWHFPFLRDGHCRIYESSANMPMTRLCHDKSTLDDLITQQQLKDIESLAKIQKDADHAELAFASREGTSRVKYPIMKSSALNRIANRLLGMIEQDDLYVNEEQIVPNEGDECELCGLAISSVTDTISCQRRRCGNTYHRDCINGIDPTSLKSTNKQFKFMPAEENQEWICATCTWCSRMLERMSPLFHVSIMSLSNQQEYHSYRSLIPQENHSKINART